MFFLLSVKRGAVSVNPKNPYQKILTFLTIFDHYLTIKGGESCQSIKSLSEKIEGVKNRGGSQFFY